MACLLIFLSVLPHLAQYVGGEAMLGKGLWNISVAILHTPPSVLNFAVLLQAAAKRLPD